MRLTKFKNGNSLGIKVKNPGPALQKILKKLKRVRENKLYGLTAIGEFLVDSITPERSIEEAEKTIRFSDRPGGSPTNTVINFFKLGISAHIIAKIGHDFNGKYLLKQISKEYFPLDGLVKDYDKPTTRVLLATGDQRLGDLSKTYREADTNLKYSEVNQRLVQKAFCLTSGVFSIEYPISRDTIYRVLKECRERDQLILIDPNFNGYARFHGFGLKSKIKRHYQLSVQIDDTPLPEKEGIQKIDRFLKNYYALSDIITPSIEDAERYFGQKMPMELAAKEFYKFSKGSLVLLTLGRNGTLMYDGRSFYKIPGYKDLKAVCTNGAGDAFKAGFLSALERSETYEDIVYSVALGNIIGAYATSRIGAWVSFPGLGKWFYIGRDLLKDIKVYKK